MNNYRNSRARGILLMLQFTLIAHIGINGTSEAKDMVLFILPIWLLALYSWIKEE